MAGMTLEDENAAKPKPGLIQPGVLRHLHEMALVR